MKHIGNLEITKENQGQFKDLVEVTGNLYIYSNCELPKLQTVGGNLYIISNRELPKLQTVGGNLYIISNCELPKLQTVGGNLDINSNCELTAQKLQTVGGNLYISSNRELPKLDVKNHQPSPQATSLAKKLVQSDFERQGYLLADGILQNIVSKKTTKNLTIYKTKKLATDITNYVVFDGESYSHGETLQQAKNDLMFKLSSRDTSEFKKWKLSDKKPIADLVRAYRSITGACEVGTKDFCKSQELKEAYTVKEVIKLTEGKFGNDKFKEFFK